MMFMFTVEVTEKLAGGLVFEFRPETPKVIYRKLTMFSHVYF